MKIYRIPAASSPSTPERCLSVCDENDGRIKKRTEEGRGSKKQEGRNTSFLVSSIPPAMGVKGELTAVSFVTIKVEVLMFGSPTLVSVICGVGLLKRTQ